MQIYIHKQFLKTSSICLIYYPNIREYLRGKQKWTIHNTGKLAKNGQYTIQGNWQHRAHKTNSIYAFYIC